MKDLEVQRNLEKNIEKVFEKIREEGLKGIGIGVDSYPIEEEITVGRLYTFGNKMELAETEIAIKNYSGYMKLIQTLDTLQCMINLNNGNQPFLDFMKVEIEKEIEFIQNSALLSLDKNYISQYSCLIKCYDSLLRMNSRFKKVDNRLPQYKNDIKVNEKEINKHNFIRGLREKINPIDDASNLR